MTGNRSEATGTGAGSLIEEYGEGRCFSGENRAENGFRAKTSGGSAFITAQCQEKTGNFAPILANFAE